MFIRIRAWRYLTEITNLTMQNLFFARVQTLSRDEYTIGFCVSISLADEMADYFRGKGIRVEAVHSKIEDDEYGREKLVEKFKEKKISVLSTVDMFNEVVDIPEIDTMH